MDAVVGVFDEIWRCKAMIGLKPCPFCGGKAVLFVNGGAKVICDNCRVQTDVYIDIRTSMCATGDSAIERAVNAWNRRT